MEHVQNNAYEVFKHILSHLDDKELLSCRLVNRAWNLQARKILENKKKIVIKSTVDILRFCKAFKGSIDGVSLNFKSFKFEPSLYYLAFKFPKHKAVCTLVCALKEFVAISGKYVVRFETDVSPAIIGEFNGLWQLHQIQFIVYILVTRLIFDKFINLENLILGLRTSQMPAEFDVTKFILLYQSLPNLQKLKTLRIKLLNEDLNPICEQLATPLITKLLWSPKLQVIIANAHSRSDSSYLKNIFVSNLSIISEKLTHLDMCEPLSHSDINSITNRKFLALKRLELSIEKPNRMNKNDLKDLLFQYSPSLLDLKLNFSVEGEDDGTTIPVLPPHAVVMTALTSLRLSSYHRGSLALKKLPKLEELTLERCESTGRILSDRKCMTTTKIHTLKLIKSNFPLSKLSWIQNLHTLVIKDFPIKPLSDVFRQCTQLRSLTLTNVGVDDSDICGCKEDLMSLISFDSLDNSVESGDTSRCQVIAKLMIAMARSVPTDLRNPSIGNLKELMSLILCGDFGDYSILFGVIECKKLNYLEIKSETDELSQVAYPVLQSELKHLKREKTHLSNSDGEPIK